MIDDFRGLLMTVARRALASGERLAWGGEGRERLLLDMLGRYYGSLFRRSWVYASEPPHFFSHRINVFRFGFSNDGGRPESFYRGFFSSEIIREGDRVLDIGCGDGFFTKRFLSARASSVDAIDIEPTAIEEATKFNPSPKITYVRLDAVKEAFPAASYDVVVWDGALGHFATEDTETMLTKIAKAIGAGGVFVGSESLGHEGSDHLQFFETLDDLGRLLKPHWKHVMLREVAYPIDGGLVRREAFWRCSNDPRRLEIANWVSH